jgi:hypothetical protein
MASGSCAESASGDLLTVDGLPCRLRCTGNSSTAKSQRARVSGTTRAAGTEGLIPRKHDQITVSLARDRHAVLGWYAQAAQEADAFVRRGDLACEDSSFHDRVRTTRGGERGHGGLQVDAQNEDLRPPSVGGLRRILERARAVAASFERHEDAPAPRERGCACGGTTTTGTSTRVMSSSAVWEPPYTLQAGSDVRVPVAATVWSTVEPLAAQLDAATAAQLPRVAGAVLA